MLDSVKSQPYRNTGDCPVVDPFLHRGKDVDTPQPLQKAQPRAIADYWHLGVCRRHYSPQDGTQRNRRRTGIDLPATIRRPTYTGLCAAANAQPQRG